ncbi:MAG: hypothetical protein A3D65_05335 [Candidatus Lloydbacteria bacterium RIFCSPHIGHO2_02_FULL_50_13]|uniref:LysM domain-containing protein n=1 Tax=Candidatus Lloydbacteria bacterium RIFCSPHIGHO2_02_FULL_50_13 TaxID=1798661 RepID=A0A1G2D9Z2_9BACT|nr:MAG: hypothetical protein A3D65_05335 [Candidatus Lloydbacteria bacterium RIFCSPHIGHO2_02_FULL_50_13]
MRAFGRVRNHTRLPKTPDVFRASLLSWKRLAFPVLVFVIFPGAVAYAGFFSFFSDIFTKVNKEEKRINSQNIVLLAAAAGSEFSPKFAPSDVNTVAGSALLADVGPIGGPADVDNENYSKGEISIYVVRAGDSYSAIANMFDVSINTILWANNLSRGANLQVGQTLVILPVSGVEYTVKKGDTLAGIVKKFKGDIDEVRAYNGLLEGDVLALGTVVIIPDGEIATAVVSTVPASSKLRGVSGVSYQGYYAPPLPAGFRKTQGLHGYNGVDLALYRSAPVLASAGGQVIVARGSGYNGGYGKYVVIAHSNGTQTLYSHLDSVSVSVGDVMYSGQQIGRVGSTGRSTGPHLHFEVRGARNPF